MTDLKANDHARLRRVLGFLDDQAPIGPELAEVTLNTAGQDATQPVSPGWVSVSAVLITLALFVPIILLSQTRSDTDPRSPESRSGRVNADMSGGIVVPGELAPEPAFDTTQLGEEVTLTTITHIGKMIAIAEGYLSNLDAEIIRVTTLGTTPHGAEAILVHAEHRDSSGELIQERCFFTQISGSCGGQPADVAAQQPNGLVPPDISIGPMNAAVGSEGTLAWSVPLDTAVAVLAVNGTSVWQGPVSRVAVFDTNLQPGDVIELTAYNRDGVVLDTYTEIAHGDYTTDSSAVPMQEQSDG